MAATSRSSFSAQTVSLLTASMDGCAGAEKVRCYLRRKALRYEVRQRYWTGGRRAGRHIGSTLPSTMADLGVSLQLHTEVAERDRDCGWNLPRLRRKDVGVWVVERPHQCRPHLARSCKYLTSTAWKSLLGKALTAPPVDP